VTTAFIFFFFCVLIVTIYGGAIGGVFGIITGKGDGTTTFGGGV